METYQLLDESYLPEAMKTMAAFKKSGMDVPAKQILLNDKIDPFALYLSQVDFPESYEADSIAPLDVCQMCTETLSLFKQFHGKEIGLKAESYFPKVCIEPQLKYLHNFISTRETNGIFTIDEICIPNIENSVQSISLAKALISAMKSTHAKEIKDTWKNDKTIPIFLGEIYAGKLQDRKIANKDLLSTIQFLELWAAYSMQLYYKKCQEKDRDSMDTYLKRVALFSKIYPQLNGYIDALKLQSIYVKDKKQVLKQIKYVLLGLATTEDVLHYFDLSSVDGEPLWIERGKMLGLSLKKKDKSLTNA